MATIQDIQALGYTVGIAFGSVQVELDALAVAQADAEPSAIYVKAERITSDTLLDLANAGKLPEAADRKQALAAMIAESALDMLTTVATDKVDFHQRAVEAAKAMPTVWHVDQTVGIDGDGNQQVVSVYVACKEDGTGWEDDSQATLDALAHQPSYDERVFQVQNFDALQAAQALTADGKDVTRETGTDTFVVDGKSLDAAAIVKLADA